VRAVLVDAGPLVALVDRSDARHSLCVETLKSIREPLVTVWPAFTEAMYLLGFSWDGQRALWEMVEGEAIKLAQLDEHDAPRMKALMHKYRDQPMDLADAGLVRIAEREKVPQIFTLDHRHFRVYRPAGVGRLFIVPTERSLTRR
jgi:predicted nucleic acid-binding protein